jgi:ABC-2 type transport system ATP-binding protein
MTLFHTPLPRFAVETHGLTKQYRSVTALGDCSVTIPEGRICGLVGPNGAGKTTLLKLLAGLAAPTSGTATVLGAAPGQDPAYLSEIGYVAQDMPLYPRMSAEDHIRIGARLNSRWDGDLARGRLAELDIPLGRSVGTLSGGQRAQVALSLALAKRPRLLLLDEPVAALDPLARRRFLATVATAVTDAEGSLTVLLSSHLISDLERVCDSLIVIAASRVQLHGDTEDLLAEHKVLVGPAKDTSALERTHTVVQSTTTARQMTLLVRLGGPVIDPAWQVEDVGLEELVLGYMGAPAVPGHAHLATVDSARSTGEVR